SIPMSAMFSMIVLRMKACPQHNTGKEGVTISLNMVYYTVIMHLKESNLLTPQLRLIDVAYLIL
ncbi:MAG: hypothetical protein E6101_11680, partial [Enterobacter sp.]|nr:hypothetical protein [Enterobacter sp.]